MVIRPKKYLGQHFLKDQGIAIKIVDSLTFHSNYDMIVEVGPGTGILTNILFEKYPEKTYLIDIDNESIAYLKKRYPNRRHQIIAGDFLRFDLGNFSSKGIGIIGNFPYNISSQILFKILDCRNIIHEVVGMVQKEVALRIAAGPGNKTYGILSVLLGAFYDIEYLFTVNPDVFHPIPKVKSAVLRLKRNERQHLPCDEIIFRKIVKQGFQNRRKTLRNALKILNLPEQIVMLKMLDLRAEQLSVEDFISLSLKIESHWKR